MIDKCKRVVQRGLKYYVYQMTEGETSDVEVNKRWQEVLEDLRTVLEEEAVRNDQEKS